MKDRKKPRVGEQVTVYSAWADKMMVGKVTELFDTQFAFETPDSAVNNTVYFCEYNGQWARHEG